MTAISSLIHNGAQEHAGGHVLDAAPGHSGAPARRSEAFDAARAHSRRVRLLRLVVPGIAALSVVMVLAGWWFSSARVPGLNVTDVSITDEGIAMNAPVLRGEDDDGRPYELRAQEAFQTLGSNPSVLMRQLEGELALNDEDTAFIRAPQARFDGQTDLLRFEEGQVELNLSSGGQARLGVTEVNLENGTMRTDEVVEIVNDEVALTAGALQGFDGGERLLFTGGVRMVITPTPDGREDGQ